MKDEANEQCLLQCINNITDSSLAYDGWVLFICETIVADKQLCFDGIAFPKKLLAKKKY